MSTIKIRAIWPHVAVPDANRKECMHILRKVAAPVMNDIHATYKTWKYKPRITRDETFHEMLRTYEVGIRIEVKDARWNKLNDGFERFVKVHNYKNKTIPGFLGSVQGGGNVLGTQVPPYNVEPRAWMDALYDKYTPIVDNLVEEVVEYLRRATGMNAWEI